MMRKLTDGWRDHEPVEMRNHRWLAVSEYFRGGKPVYLTDQPTPRDAPCLVSQAGGSREEAVRKMQIAKPVAERIYGVSS